MSVARDLRVLLSLIKGAAGRKGDHAQRMESFYAHQAEDYDDFRKRLLPGRAELLAELPLEEGATVVDLGGGTGANLDFLHDNQHARLSTWYVVDLSPSLLAVAERRKLAAGWQHVEVVEADATSWRPTKEADLVLFSYSLTMIPDWRQALSHAESLLRPGGHVAIVDFTVSHPKPPTGLTRHGWLTRNLWPRWFAWDGVYLNPEHLPTLLERFETRSLVEDRTRLPYLPGSRVPYYRFIGQKPSEPQITSSQLASNASP